MDLDKIYSTDFLLESRAKKRFRLDGFSESTLMVRARQQASILLQRLPSNYNKVVESNMGLLFRAISEELQRFQDSLTGVNMDASFASVRPEFLYQNFAAYLFLGNRSAIGPTLTENEYRDFLQKVKKAYLHGARKDAIEQSLADILGLSVVVRELYLEARKPNSPYGLKDTHRMLCDILMESEWDRPVGDLLKEISFYTSLIKPAHALLTTRLVWLDTVGIAGGCYPGDFIGADANGSVPQYDVDPDGTQRSYLLRLMDTTGPSEMVDGFVPGEGPEWRSGVVQSKNSLQRTITLQDGRVLVIGYESLFYKHDTEDYRVLLGDVLVGDLVWYQAIDIAGSFKFWRTPEELVANPNLMFDPLFNRKPIFQEYVKKVMDAKGRFPQVAAKCQGALVDRWVSDALKTEYEDLRDNCDYPSARRHSSYVSGDTGYQPTSNQPMAISLGGGLYQLSLVPVLGPGGDLAAASDLQLWVDGKPVSAGITGLDPASGTFFITPGALGSTGVMRVDHWSSGRFPGKEQYSVTTEASRHPSTLPDVGGLVQVAESNAIVKYLSWPYATTQDQYGDPRDFQIDKFPVLDQMGNLASLSDVQVLINDVATEGALVSLDAILGHARLSFMPPPGTKVTFKYYFTEKSREYALIPDDPSHTYDAAYGNFYGYSLVPDYPDDADPMVPLQAHADSKLIGYRYRGYQMASSSLLDSESSMNLDSYSSPAYNKASFRGGYGTLDSAELVFSPEHLKDTSRYITLDDAYLKNGLEPELKLQPGTPTFQQTFSDETGANGLIRHMPLSDFRENHRILMYADLRQESFEEGGETPIAPLCDSRGMNLAIQMTEEYFPNREMRLNDYMDYIQRVDVMQIDDGSLDAMSGSDIVKSIGRNWSMVPRGGVMSFGGHKYTVIDPINADTLRLDQPVSLPTGAYTYDLTMETAPQVKVNLNDLVRRLNVNISAFQPGYVPSASDWVVGFDFPDPDPDPYPRTADNPNYPTPTAPLTLADVHEDSGARDLLLDEAAAQKMVKWRNWDQAIIVTGEKVATGVDPASYPEARVRPGGGNIWDLYAWSIYPVVNVGPTVPVAVHQELVGRFVDSDVLDGSWVLDGTQLLDG
jgi:hypothetical protein